MKIEQLNGLATNNADINIISNGGIGRYSANKQAIDKIKSLPDTDFEKAIADFDSDTQMFLRIARVKSLQSKETKLVSKMAEYVEYTSPAYRGKDKKAKSAKYYKYQKEFNAVRRERNDLQNKISKAKREARENEAKAKKKFVNSFGEATKRNITTSTYEKAQRKTAKEIIRFIGG